MASELSTVSDAVTQIQNGGSVIVVDDEDRENEGDLIMAAEKATQENIAFMIRHTSGVICAPCEPQRLAGLDLPLMVEKNEEPHRCVFTVSADYLPGMTTGISALERSRTLNALADSEVSAADFVRPGHIFPLKYQPGGVLVRSGHTEAAIDLCRLAGLKPVGALCELVNDDGTMKRLPELLRFADDHDLPIISIDSLIRYQAGNDALVEEVADAAMMLNGANLRVHVYRTVFDDKHITAVVKGDIDGTQPTLVRVVKGVRDRDFLTSAVVSDNVIHRSLKMITEAPQGVFIYLPAGNQPTREDELGGAVWREVGLGSYILSSLGVRRIHLLASRELSFPGVASFGLSIETVIKEV
ncbi:MAG: 3,4-dihydroxy-2-butanone-4-phosphate synthase [Gammaproteobacteria bacterium]|nr:3,4-dihydroxy-2-butanone-4-phosphate synthase [Gammaproteobacteria bacterium]